MSERIVRFRRNPRANVPLVRSLRRWWIPQSVYAVPWRLSVYQMKRSCSPEVNFIQNKFLAKQIVLNQRNLRT